jgi:hypothetical protein
MIWWIVAIALGGTVLSRFIRLLGDVRAINRGTYGNRLARRHAIRSVRRWFR